ncbi:hypothetical protein COY93_04610 [Candidatus Uhrbacteria bacterium CG_4_10_14_0_8_um_filter_58_22]|uniref:CYTH domain-containing protein n=1 Tax=Candidatus Uhrbacteria bacterium CG_4_10_14_0_8_um_filter_58_22 TaxID=1975029 RepID=A0A2M7Q8Z7_9BACT|nr:MAG: hypothetical protein AUJ19_01845 [Parcubacteria group bacterium CG1_02_58_44]PIY61917.1 MAG: hypothetical protein COY93_04610 [Candidatus Uhrbacteria bacterium CG_4_10_14_0_8_um_filter_58_22]
MSVFECEVRSFVDGRKFDELLERFGREGEPLGEDFQETHYLSGAHDLRIQRSDREAKLWLKSGELHDSVREEFEVRCRWEDFPGLSEMMAALGHTVEVKWFRERRRFRWHGVKATLDITRGYGRIVELEELVGPDGREAAVRRLYVLLTELGVQPTSREEFDRRYAEYRERWRELVAEAETELAVI